MLAFRTILQAENVLHGSIVSNADALFVKIQLKLNQLYLTKERSF
jgi:hypothetical protein